MFQKMGVKTSYIGKLLDDPQKAIVILRTRKCYILYFYESWKKPILKASGHIYARTKITRWISWKNRFFMNYQLLIESYSFGTALSEQEIELLSMEL